MLSLRPGGVQVSSSLPYRQVMNLYDPRDERGYVAVADHGL